MAVAEVPDGAVVVEWAVKGADYLVRDVLNKAGDSVVRMSADARDSALAAAERPLVTP